MKASKKGGTAPPRSPPRSNACRSCATPGIATMPSSGRRAAPGFVARSVYKLQEIDKKLRLLRAGDRVLDLGCRPGSWLQYALEVVGKHGAVVGIDRDPMPQPIAGARVMQGDIFTTPDAELLGTLAAFDVVLSDMAPNTTGVRATDQARRRRCSRRR